MRTPNFLKDPAAQQSRFDSAQDEMVYLLRSIRAMMTFFVILAIIGLIGGAVLVAHVVNDANNSGF